MTVATKNHLQRDFYGELARLYPQCREAWRLGVAQFNQGRFWHAHESWELNWRFLPEPIKTYLQALIQVCGAMHLEGLGRSSPAHRLYLSALGKLVDSSNVIGSTPMQLPERQPSAQELPQVEIPFIDGLEDQLRMLVAAGEGGLGQLNFRPRMRARLLGVSASNPCFAGSVVK